MKFAVVLVLLVVLFHCSWVQSQTLEDLFKELFGSKNAPSPNSGGQISVDPVSSVQSQIDDKTFDDLLNEIGFYDIKNAPSPNSGAKSELEAITKATSTKSVPD